MIELGIETASNAGALALLDGDHVLGERRWTVTSNYSLELLPALGALFDGAGIARTAIGAIAVDIGPGGYGSLRTGVATAQAMALALGIPLAGIGRLAVDAYPHHAEAARLGATLVAVHAMGSGRYGWAAFATTPGRTRTGETASDAQGMIIAPRADDAGVCALAAPAPALWCGEITDELRAAWHAAGRTVDRTAGDGATDSGARSAVDVVRLARALDAYGDPATVDVVYLRPPPITPPRTASA